MSNQNLDFSTEISIRFRDIDAMGHVNNAVYFTYMETARTGFFMQALNLKEPKELPFILAHASCDFHSAARFGEKLIVRVVINRIGTKSFALGYRISSGDGRLVAEGRSVLVTYDYDKRAAIPIPTELRQLLSQYYLPTKT